MKIGIFGGTFDPPHLGHLRLAEAARAQLQLDSVLWVLTADPPHKQGNHISPVADRLAMVEAAIAGQPGFALSRVDIDRPGPHWAADTVALLGQQYPGDDLYYLMGGDSLRDLPTWGRPLEFISRCRLAVMRRPNDVIDLPGLEQQLPGITAKVHFVQAPSLEVASHEIRQRVRASQSIAGMVPEAVARVIAARGLYRDSSETASRATESAVAAPAGSPPPNYREVLYWRITQDRWRLVVANLLSLPLAAVAGLAFTWFALQFGGLFKLSRLELGAREVPVALSAIAATLILHELAHGIAMRLCGARPRYGFLWQALAFYATAPGYAFTRRQYFAVILAPLLGLSLLAMLGMILLAGSAWVVLLLVCATINVAGASGDVWILWIVARHPRQAYVVDERDGVRIFMPA